MQRVTKAVRLTVPNTTLTIEYDPTVRAWYIRFREGKVAKTMTEDMPGYFYTVDLDDRNQVLGFEMVGVTDFKISMLRNLPNIDTSRVDFENSPIVEARSRKDLVAA